MRKINLIFLSAVLLTSCNNGVKQSDYGKLQAELTECKKTVDELQNTPQVRLTTGQQFLANNDYVNAKKVFGSLIEKFPASDEAKKAQLLIAEIEKKEIIQNKAEEKRKILGYRSLKENSSIAIENVTLKFNSVTTGDRWNFEYDKYDYYKYRTAERGNTYLLAKVSVSSKVKETRIPLISVYQLSDEKLILIGIMKREFVNDPNTSYNNVDFRYVSTVSLSHAIEISEESLKEKPTFVVVKRKNCSRYETGYYLDTDVERTITQDNNQCDIKTVLSLDDFNSDYVVVKIFNKNRL